VRLQVRLIKYNGGSLLKAVIIRFKELYMILFYITSYVFLISGDLHASERALKATRASLSGAWEPSLTRTMCFVLNGYKQILSNLRHRYALWNLYISSEAEYMHICMMWAWSIRQYWVWRSDQRRSGLPYTSVGKRTLASHAYSIRSFLRWYWVRVHYKMCDRNEGSAYSRKPCLAISMMLLLPKHPVSSLK